MVYRRYASILECASLLEASVGHICSGRWEINPTKNQGSTISVKRMMATLQAHSVVARDNLPMVEL